MIVVFQMAQSYIRKMLEKLEHLIGKRYVKKVYSFSLNFASFFKHIVNKLLAAESEVPKIKFCKEELVSTEPG